MLYTNKLSKTSVTLGLLGGLLAAPMAGMAPVAQAQPMHRAPGTERVLYGEVAHDIDGNRFTLRRPGRNTLVVLVGRHIPPFGPGNQVEVTGHFENHRFLARRLRVTASRG